MKLELQKSNDGKELRLVYYKPGAVTEALVFGAILFPILLVTFSIAIFVEDGITGVLIILGLFAGLFLLFIISIKHPHILGGLAASRYGYHHNYYNADISDHIPENENLAETVAENFNFISHIRSKKIIKISKNGKASSNISSIPDGALLQSVEITPYLQLINNQNLQHCFIVNFNNTRTKFIAENNYNELIHIAKEIAAFTKVNHVFDNDFKDVLEKDRNRFDPTHIRDYEPKKIYTFVTDDLDMIVRKWHGKVTLFLFVFPLLSSFVAYHLYGGDSSIDIITTVDKIQHVSVLAVAFFSFYFALAIYANRTEIRVKHNNIVVDIKPTPWFGIKHLNMKDIIAIERTSTERTKPYPHNAYYRLDLTMKNGRTHKLLDKIETAEEAELVKNIIEDRLTLYRLSH